MGCGSSQSAITANFKNDLERMINVAIYPSPDTEVIKTTCKRPIIEPPPQSAQKIELRYQLIQAQSESRISAFDGRRQVLEAAQWPNSVHGVLVFTMKTITMQWGTGIMIGPQIVLTAGSNLYDTKTKTHADIVGMQFLPGMNGKMAPFGPVEVLKYFVSPNYIKEGKEDYGILFLKQSIGEQTGHFGICVNHLEPEEIKAKRINVTGYPGDKVEDKPNTFEMWGMEGEVSHIDQDQGHINYSIDTYNGQSGSGVWYKEGEDYYVCGIHKTGSTATLLTRDIYKQIYAWLEPVYVPGTLFRPKQHLLRPFQINSACISHLIKQKLDDFGTLDLRYLRTMGIKQAKILAQDTSWINLSTLFLDNNKIRNAGAKALAQNTSWVNLSVLSLRFCDIGSEGAKALAQNTSWVKLSELDLTCNHIGSEGAKALAQNTTWVNLSSLMLNGNNIDSEGAKVLGQNTSWTKLSCLML